MDAERAELIRDTWREGRHRVDWRTSGPFVRMMPIETLPITCEPPSAETWEVAIKPLQYELHRHPQESRASAYFTVVCEGLTVHHYPAAYRPW